MVQANQLRKQQLVELGLLREEEKQKMLREHESEVSKYTYIRGTLDYPQQVSLNVSVDRGILNPDCLAYIKKSYFLQTNIFDKIEGHVQTKNEILINLW